MYFDIAMPSTLFAVTLIALFMNRKVEQKLKSTLQKREFRLRDTALLVIATGITVSIAVFIPSMAITAIFLFAYSMLLFIFTYLFSDLSRIMTEFFCGAFLIVSLAAATASYLNLGVEGTSVYGTLAFAVLSGLACIALLYDFRRASTKERWYLGIFPPALFVCLYVFFGGTPIWSPYLSDLYAVIFAVLITLYLGSLFTWKTTLFFSGIITVLDIILVLVTRTMVEAASTAINLGLPVVVAVPIIPLITTTKGIVPIFLGLGDFFFAGLIAIQTLKKYGRNSAIFAVAAMAVSFFVFEAFTLNYEIGAFPGTLMIICGWLAFMLIEGLKKMLDH
jgi:hypothetical protein